MIGHCACCCEIARKIGEQNLDENHISVHMPAEFKIFSYFRYTLSLHNGNSATQKHCMRFTQFVLGANLQACRVLPNAFWVYFFLLVMHAKLLVDRSIKLTLALLHERIFQMYIRHSMQTGKQLTIEFYFLYYLRHPRYQLQQL